MDSHLRDPNQAENLKNNEKNQLNIFLDRVGAYIIHYTSTASKPEILFTTGIHDNRDFSVYHSLFSNHYLAVRSERVVFIHDFRDLNEVSDGSNLGFLLPNLTNDYSFPCYASSSGLNEYYTYYTIDLSSYTLTDQEYTYRLKNPMSIYSCHILDCWRGRRHCFANYQ